jgi:hypothetical protein
MFRFELSPWAPNRHQGLTSSPRTSVLPTFDCQSAIAKVLSHLRQPLIISTRNGCVKRRTEFFRGRHSRLTSPKRVARTIQSDSCVAIVPGTQRALILPTDRSRNNPRFSRSGIALLAGKLSRVPLVRLVPPVQLANHRRRGARKRTPFPAPCSNTTRTSLQKRRRQSSAGRMGRVGIEPTT